MNYREALHDYFFRYPQEEKLKRQVMHELGGSDEILYREHEEIHLTVSAMVLSPDFTKVLLLWHNIYREYGWPGGHADGNPDLLQVALREVAEETGIAAVPLCDEILSVDIFSVAEHEKRGKKVAAHQHLNAAYVFLASPELMPVSKPDENSDVAWFDLDKIDEICAGEPHMLPVYHKLIDRAKERRKDLKREKTDLLPIVEPLMNWYHENARVLPWRENKDPYRIWISEIMLQQTRVDAVIPYFNRFVSELPDVFSLAEVSEERLMKLWEGLGYYSRARNLQRAAREIAENRGGVFPCDAEELVKLPGIGEYTAGAISSIAFEHPTPAVDGNVLRVISRITEDDRDVLQPAVKKEMAKRLEKIYPPVGRGDFTQALMELGATVCLPNGAPLCEKCPVRFLCQACEHQTAEQLPTKTPKKARRIEKKTVFLLFSEGKVALSRREKTGLLAGMWEFPNAEGWLDRQQAEELLAQWGLKPVKTEPYKKEEHVFTHVQWEMTSYRIWCEKPSDRFIWVSPQEFYSEMALPSAFKAFFAAVSRR